MIFNNLLRNQKIKNKIMLLYVPLVLLPLLALGYVSVDLYTDSIIRKTEKSMKDTSTLITIRINGIMKNVENAANMLTISLNRIIGEQNRIRDLNAPVVDVKLYTEITNELNFSRLVFPEVESLAFINEQGRVYGSSLQLESNDVSVLDTDMLQTLKKTSGYNVWFPMQRRDYLTLSRDDVVMTLGKKIIDIRTGSMIGYLILNLNEKTLSEVYRNVGFAENERYLILDGQDTVVSAADPELRLAKLNLPELEGWTSSGRDAVGTVSSAAGEYLFSLTPMNADLRLLHLIPLDELTREVNQMRNVILVSGFICLIVTVLAANRLSDVIAKPIVHLTNSMKRFREGHLDMELQVRSRDEIGLLAVGFNSMIRNIWDLLERIKDEQRQKHEIELALTQSQIRPHFLYNTLDVIYKLIEMNRPLDAQRTTKALAEFYRRVLSKGRDLITLEEEMEIVRHYLSIQQLRYADVFRHVIEIEHDMLWVPIPKLSLQPLVENAIYHGLKEKDAFGLLAIKGYRAGDECRIEISDDGAGMTEERLRTILSELSAEKNETIYGLFNVDRRLKLNFGREAGLEIESAEGKGTKVTIRLPLKQHVSSSKGKEGLHATDSHRG